MSQYEIWHDAENNFVGVKHRGDWDRNRSDEILVEVYALCRDHDIDCVLIDHRDTALNLDTFGVFERASELGQPGAMAPVGKIAFVHRRDVAELYAFFIVALKNRGVNGAQFTDDVDAAIAWLSMP